MIKNLIKKYNINVYGMIKNGTIAIITMVGVGYFFGVKNIMIAFPIALTSAVLGRQNFYVKTLYKVMWLLIIDIVIVITSFLSSINVYSGILINFIMLFLIMYILISQYDLTFYKPFIMLYIFTQYTTVSIKELPERILSVVFGVLVITILNYVKRINEKVVLGNSFLSYIKLLKSQVDNIKIHKFSDKLMDNGTKLMREITYKVYITRHKKYLTTNLGIIQFKLFINLEYFNLLLKDIYNESLIGLRELNIISELLEKFTKYSEGSLGIGALENNVMFFIKNNKQKNDTLSQICNIMLELFESMEELSHIKKRDINKIYKQWERSELDLLKTSLSENFKGNNIRFKFAMRMSITLTLALLVGEFLGLYKIIWGVITIMAIMQPYYEDTISNAKDRVKGNLIAILITTLIIDIFNNKILTISMLVIALYLLYGFKEFYKISLFAAIASICISSLTANVNLLIIYRGVYVIGGAIVVLIANRIIFPYKLKDGITQLIDKIQRYNKCLVLNMKLYKDNTERGHKIRDIVIHQNLLLQKLNLRNIQYGSEKTNEFIKNNTKILIKAAYILFFEDTSDNKRLKEVLKEYSEFNDKKYEI